MGWYDDTGDSFGDFSGVDWGNDPTDYSGSSPVDNGGGYGTDTYDLDHGSSLNNYTAPVPEPQQEKFNQAYNNFFRKPDPEANPEHDWKMYVKGQNRTNGLMNNPTAGSFMKGFGDGLKEWHSSQMKFNPKSVGIPLDVNIPIQNIVGQLTNPLYSAGGLMLGIAGGLGGTAPDYSVGPGGQPFGYYANQEGKDPRDILYPWEQPEEVAEKTTQNLGIEPPTMTTLLEEKAPYEAALEYLISRGSLNG